MEEPNMTEEQDRLIAEKTGRLYASIWDSFNPQAWEEFSQNHAELWSRWDFPEGFYQDKVCLDAGCGSGRAVRSMLLAGAAQVHAVDAGEGCIRNTVERNRSFGDRLQARLASVLELPYPDNTFDFVHCDGVLHHTTDPHRGFLELVRVLKPGGTLAFCVYGRGGLLNLAIYSARLFRHLIPQSFTLAMCRLFSRNPVHWYAVMDCMHVHIRKNYYEREIRPWIESAGLINIRRLDSKWGPYAYGRLVKGEGYLRFLAAKPR